MNNVSKMKVAAQPTDTKRPHESQIFIFFVPTTLSLTQDVILLIMLPIMFRPCSHFFSLAQKHVLKMSKGKT